jgi:integrase
MANSSGTSAKGKPKKPTKDFPLFPHAAGVWAKKVRGRLHYFGAWSDPQAALNRWLDVKDDLLAGRTPRPKTGELTVKMLADRFLTTKLNRVRSGELSEYSYRDYVEVCQHAADVFGKHSLVTGLASADFERLRQSFAKSHGPARLGKDITTVRSLFKYGYETGMIDVPVRFGPDFKAPSRTARLKARRVNGRMDFDAAELRRIIDAAMSPLKAAILLGVNAALGNTDCGELRVSSLDLETGWLDYPRLKTQVDRRCWLWPETRKAIREALVNRPTAKDAADADCLFITKYGRKWCRLNDAEDPARRTRCDAIGREFAKLMKSLGLNGRRGFYSLRHTFETVAGESRDQVAVDLVMGHSDSSMSATYRHSISDQRLRDVAETVRRWLFPATAEGGEA